MLTYKNRLPPSALMGYISPAPHKTGAGTANLLTTQAHSRASGFFTCKASSRLFIRIMAGRMGEPQGSPGSCVAGFCSPVRLATSEPANSCGELSQLTTQGYPSWPTANSAARRLRASIRKPKSIVVCSAPDRYPESCVSICCLTTHTPSLRYTLRPYSAIWRTICGTLKNWWERQENSSPENLTQKQHSAFWWSVCLHDIQEAP
ncbi:ash family protein [Salmonella enterica subsp. enterica serovar Sandiego]|nr:ash family protein [Salmonella enterica subsp. enterica serovar Bonariensis]EHQ1843649.1 ash family protein [Salmonella enterica subsp. enterica serovar Saintpaul]EIH3064798.1 ash family protein [Salmonella enterica subsp. enterica serovar Sandiego]HCZ4730860.1 ash family protein [Salmonella enterica subsp. enterica serovar Saintpaul str. CFSAN004137]